MGSTNPDLPEFFARGGKLTIRENAADRAQSATMGLCDVRCRRAGCAIVGIEIPIDRLEGKLKASQDEAAQDRLGTVRGLRNEARDEAGAMADLVMKRRTQPGDRD